MPPRRRFLVASAGAAALAGLAPGGAAHAASQAVAMPAEDRAAWTRRLLRLADPVLTQLAQDRLRATMPVETGPGGRANATVTHLEAVGRLLAGLAPWLDSTAASLPDAERGPHTRLRQLVTDGLRVATAPEASDRLNFTEGSQPLVDAAFLAQALLRMPSLWASLDAPLQARLIDDLVATRAIKPYFNNWLLFSATIEAFLAVAGARWDRMRVDYALRQHEQWYLGDGLYGDGPEFHWDYYNGYVIQPMLLDILQAVGNEDAAWTALREPMQRRARRYAEIQERLIATDGSFPAVGRSLPYRCGAFQPLAQAALHETLPEAITPGQARAALGAVIARTLDAPGTYDAAGWLRIGLCGHQNGLGESYISTGSLYLCSVAFLPLGLPPVHAFWSAPAAPWTAVRVWRGEAIPIDSALRGT